MSQGTKKDGAERWSTLMSGARWTPTEGARVVAEWKRSGLSVSEFASLHDVDVQRIYFWRSRIDRERSRDGGPSRLRLVEVKVAPTMAATVEAQRIEITLENGRRLSVAESIDVGVLERVVAALGRC